MVELRLPKCILRPWRPSDADSLARHANSRAVWRNLMDRFPHPYTAQDARRWLQATSSDLPGLHLAIEVDGEAAGGIGLEPQADVYRRTAKVGYWLGEAVWGRGIATEALAALTAHAFTAFDLLRLEAPVFEWNRASMRVLEKCGYACESRQRRAGVKDGQVMDVLLYVRLRAAPAPPRRRFVELSHPIEDAMVTYPGLPAPRISAHMDRAASAAHYAPGTTFHIGRIDMVANTGTYLDAPFHRWADGLDLAALPLDRCAELEGRRVRVPDARAADAACFLDQDLDGMAVLIHTGWSRHWRTPQYAGDAPFLTEAGACRLRAAGAALVGIDSINIDDRADPRRPAHSVLLEAGIPIVEHLTGLDQLPERGFRFSAAPARVAHMGSFPVRAYAVLED